MAERLDFVMPLGRLCTVFKVKCLANTRFPTMAMETCGRTCCPFRGGNKHSKHHSFDALIWSYPSDWPSHPDHAKCCCEILEAAEWQGSSEKTVNGNKSFSLVRFPNPRKNPPSFYRHSRHVPRTAPVSLLYLDLRPLLLPSICTSSIECKLENNLTEFK